MQTGIHKYSSYFSSKMLLALLLFVICLYAYDTSRFENTSGDTISNRYFPVSVLKHHTYKLNSFSKDLDGVGYAAIFSSNGDWLPRSFWGMLLFTVPFYAVADILNWYGPEWTHDKISYVSRCNAIVVSSLTVVLIFALLIEFVSVWPAFVSALLFAFGTWNFSLGAQGISTQTVTVFLIALSMHMTWKLANDRRASGGQKWAVYLGIIHGLFWLVRSQDLLLVIPMLLLLKNLKQLVSYLFVMLLMIGPITYLYVELYGDPLGWMGLLVQNSPDWVVYQLNFLKGFTGLLFSPNRGAIIFFPLLLLSVYLWKKFMPFEFSRAAKRLLRFRFPVAPNGIPQKFSLVLACGALLYFTSLSFLAWWHCSWSYGSRYLYNFQPLFWPVFALAINDMFEWFKGRKHKLPVLMYVVIVVMSVQSIVVHTLGHRNFDIYVWNSKKVPVDDKRAWDFNDLMLEATWEAGSNKHRWSSALERLKKLGF